MSFYGSYPSSTPNSPAIHCPKSRSKRSWSSSKTQPSSRSHRSPIGFMTPNRFRPFEALTSKKYTRCFGGSGSAYPFPLDRVRREKSFVQFGAGPEPVPQDASFEANQSFPRASKPRVEQTSVAFHGFRGDELNSFSFCTGHHRGKPEISTLASPDSGMKRSTSGGDSIVSKSEQHSTSNAFGIDPIFGSSLGVCGGIQNSYKGVITFDAVTKQILVVNDTACRLFEFDSGELCSLGLLDLFSRSDDDDGCAPEVLTEDDLEYSGQLVLISGKVVEAVSKSRRPFPVSLWIRRLEGNNVEGEPRCLAIVEPVRRIKSTIVFDGEGVVLVCEESLAALHGYSSSAEVEGRNVRQLLPSLDLSDHQHHHRHHHRPSREGRLSEEIRKQRTTGTRQDGSSFAVSVYILSAKFASGFVESNSTKVTARDCHRAVAAADATARNELNLIADSTPVTSRNLNLSLICEPSLTELSDLSESSNVDVSTDVEPETEPEPDDASDTKRLVYTAIVCVFANISGMITLLPDGIIHSCNHYFALNLFGYSQNQLLGKNISQLIPSFYDDLRFLDSAMLPLYEDNGIDGEEVECESLDDDDDSTFESVDVISRNLANSLDLTDNGRSTNNLDDHRTKLMAPSSDVNGNPQSEPAVEVDRFRRPASPPPPPTIQPPLTSNYSTSTPYDTPTKATTTTTKPCPPILEGSYYGIGRHRNGADLSIVYQVRSLEFDGGQVLHCLWISHDAEDPADDDDDVDDDDDDVHSSSTCSTNSALSSSLYSSHQKCGGNDSTHSIGSMVGDFRGGAFSEQYTTLQQIGKGAFGSVRHGHRISDGTMVVTKFILKSRVYKECWVEDAVFKKVVPLEVSLLKTINHPNIVQVLDVFENDDYFQMVMEKHGCGMDLFEFIERSPNLDEALASYIFRQVGSAVSYLHSLNIIHRDVKDENIILNERYHVKLIDFGSAAFMTSDRTFSTFCGTVEYCSPEVLRGDKYRGPELEMWSLGVTLYTLVFGENPFFDVDETIRAVLQPPFEVSADLVRLISHLLHPVPSQRCSISELMADPWLCQVVDVSRYSFNDVCHSEEDRVRLHEQPASC